MAVVVVAAGRTAGEGAGEGEGGTLMMAGTGHQWMRNSGLTTHTFEMHKARQVPAKVQR